MKKHRLHDIVLGMVIMALVMGLAMPALASNVGKTLYANYMDIKLVIDGVEVVPKDAGGNIVEPFVVDGTTYLPVRAVGEALGKEVTWDGNTKTVYVGAVPATEGEKNWTGLRTGYKHTAEDLVNTFKGVEAVNGEQYKDNMLQFRPAGAPTTEWITVEKHGNELWIKGLANYLGVSSHDERYKGYLPIVNGIIDDLIAGEDAETLKALVHRADELRTVLEASASTDEEAQAAADVLNSELKIVHKLNNVTVDWSNWPGYPSMDILRIWDNSTGGNDW